MDDKIIDDIFQLYKDQYGFKVTNADDLFEAQSNLLEHIMKLGRRLEKKLYDEIGNGYEGNKIIKDGESYEFKENKKKQSMDYSEE
jgi:hypothetical protein